MKERTFWMILGFIGISFIMNLLYSHSKQIKEPVFLDHYIKTRIEQHNWIDFFYLANKNDNSQISYIKLGDFMGYVHNDSFYGNSRVNNIDTYPHQALRKVSVQWSSLQFEYDEEFSFNEMEVYFTNGEMITASIGEVIIHPGDYLTRGEPSPLQQLSAGSSNNGSSGSTFQATEPYTVEEILFPFKEPIEDLFTFTITGNPNQREQSLEDLKFPIHLDKDSHLQLIMKLKNKNFTNPMQFFIQLPGKTETGKTFTNYMDYNLHPYLKKNDVKRIIREKTESDSVE